MVGLPGRSAPSVRAPRANRPAGAGPASRGVGVDPLTVGQPDLVASDALVRPRGQHPGPARVLEHDLDHVELLAPRGSGPLLDPHPQRLEAVLRIAHEREQLGDLRQLVAQARELRGTLAGHGDGEGTGARAGHGWQAWRGL